MKWSLVVFAVALSACDMYAPANVAPIVPRGEWRAWWKEMEACSGRQRDFDSVGWYVVDAPGVFAWDGGYAAGLTRDEPLSRPRIYLTSWHLEFAPVARLRDVLKHEVLHVLGFRGHPVPPFETCAPINN